MVEEYAEKDLALYGGEKSIIILTTVIFCL